MVPSKHRLKDRQRALYEWMRRGEIAQGVQEEAKIVEGCRRVWVVWSPPIDLDTLRGDFPSGQRARTA